MASLDRHTLLVFLGLALLGVATSIILIVTLGGSGGGELTDFRVWSPRLEEIASQHAADRLAMESFQPNAADRALLDALAKLHAAEIAAGGSSGDAAYATARETYRARVEQFVLTAGPERYNRLGLFARARFLEAVVELSKRARADDTKLETFAREAESDPAMARIRALAGDFIRWGVRAGLLDDTGQTGDVQLFIAATLYKVRWLKWAEQAAAFDRLLSPLERRALLAYQVEFQPALSLTERLAALQQLRELDPAYPSRAMEIVILARAGKTAEATRRLQRALRETPDDELLQRVGTMFRARREPPAARTTSPGASAGDEGARIDGASVAQ